MKIVFLVITIFTGGQDQKIISYMPSVEACKLAMTELGENSKAAKCVERVIKKESPKHPWGPDVRKVY